MKGFSGFKSPMKGRDTSLTGGREENVVHGGQVHPVFNPQYIPGHQVASSSEEEEEEGRQTSRRKSTTRVRSSRVKRRKICKKKRGSTDCPSF